MQKDVRDVFTPVRFEVSFGLRKTTAPKHASKAFAALRPVLQRAAGNGNTVSSQVGGASERASERRHNPSEQSVRPT